MITAENSPQPQLLSTSEAAKRLGVSIHWLKTARFRPELAGPPFVKIGRSIRYDPRDLEAWIAERKFRGTYEYGTAASKRVEVKND